MVIDSAGSSLCTPLPDSAEIFSTGASPMNRSRSRTWWSRSARASASGSSSCLLRSTTTGLPAASIRSARRWSWAVTPTVLSITSSATSEWSTAWSARTSE